MKKLIALIASLSAAFLMSAAQASDFKLINSYAARELTISSGSVTPFQGAHRIDTEADAASDDLVTIVGGSRYANGDLILIFTESGSRDVTVKNGTGNIFTCAASDVVLDLPTKSMLLRYNGFNWYEVCESAPATAAAASPFLVDNAVALGATPTTILDASDPSAKWLVKVWRNADPTEQATAFVFGNATTPTKHDLLPAASGLALSISGTNLQAARAAGAATCSYLITRVAG